MYDPLPLIGGLPQSSTHNPFLSTGITSPFTPAPVGSPAAASGQQAGESSFVSTLGNVIGAGLQTATNFATGLLQLDFLKRAQSVANQTGATVQVPSGGVAPTGTDKAVGNSFIQRLPNWALGAAVAGVGVIGLVLLLRKSS